MCCGSWDSTGLGLFFHSFQSIMGFSVTFMMEAFTVNFNRAIFHFKICPGIKRKKYLHLGLESSFSQCCGFVYLFVLFRVKKSFQDCLFPWASCILYIKEGRKTY